MKKIREIDWKSSKVQNLILFAMILCFGIAYISLCFNYNLGVDEAYSVRTFNKPFLELIERTAKDTHPPLYYFIARAGYVLFGNEIPFFKFIPVAFGILTMLLAVIYIRPRMGFFCAFFYILFLFGIPYLTEYIIQIRMYAQVLFFVTWSALAAVEVYENMTKKNYMILFIAALCACYTHNYGLLAAFIIYMILGVFLWQKDKKQMKYWFISGVLITLCFLPWMFILIHQMNNMPGHFCCEPITGKLLLEIMTEIFACAVPYTAYMFWVLILITVIIGVFYTRPLFCKKEGKLEEETVKEAHNAMIALCMLSVFILIFLLGIVLSIALLPLLAPRYMVSVLGVLSIAFAYTASRLTNYGKVVCVVLVLSLGIQGYVTNYGMEYLLHNSNATVSYMKENLTNQDVILYNESGYRWIYECYYDEDQLIFLDDFDFSSDFHEAYFFDSCCEPWISKDKLAENGLTEEYIGKFGMEFNDFYIYKISKGE